MTKKKIEKIWKEKCYICGKKQIPIDSFVRYGTLSDEYPEPLDEEYVCEKCWNEYYENWCRHFEEGSLSGDWQKSDAEEKAAKKYKLKWSNGLGVLGSKLLWEDSHKYISLKRYNQLKDLPYYGYCDICGSVGKGGYCSNKKCEKSFLFGE